MKFGEFEVGERIGRGGMGTVWKAHHPRRSEAFAVKISTHPRSTAPDFRRRFEHEVRAMARLRHPNVVRVFDYGICSGAELPGDPDAPAEGAPWVVLEYAPGGELEPESIDDWESLESLLTALLQGLGHSHARGLVHRDIKPQNLLGVERRGKIVTAIADFGIAHALDRQRPSLADSFTARNAEEATGTPRYMAPEQFLGHWRDYGPHTDLYAVGILAYLLACGKAPFHGGSFFQFAAKHMSDPFPPLQPTFDVPEHFEPWVRRMTLKAPRDRPPSARVALQRLRDAPHVVPGSWRAAEPDDEPGRAPVGLGLFGLQRTFLVGRERQREALWSALDEARRGGVVARLLVGANGVGKSRLSDWLAEVALESGAATRVLRASFSRDREGNSSLAWMLAEHLRCVGMKSEALTERLEALLGETWSDHALRALHQVLVQADSVGADITAPTVKESMVFEIVRRVVMLEAASEPELGPVIIQLEDLDADASGASHRLVESLKAAGLGDLPGVVIVATSSSSVDGIEPIELEPLGPDAFRRLLRDELGLPTAISDVVERLSDGNPLFALQLLEHGIERGTLHLDGEGELASDDVPTTLESLWSARVAQLSTRLGDDAQPVLTSAGALGTPIELTEWLSTAGELGVDIESPLFSNVSGALVDAGLGRWDDADRLQLAHPTLAPLLASVSGFRARRRAHGAAARALSSLYSANERGLALRVAGHFRESGQPNLAWFALEPALRAATDVVDAIEIGAVAEAMLTTLDAMDVGLDDPRRARAVAYRAIPYVTGSRADDRERGAKMLAEAMNAVEGAEPEVAAQVEGIAAWSSITLGGRDEAAETLEKWVADERVSSRVRTMNRVFLTHLHTYRHDDEGVRRHARLVLSETAPLAWKLRSREALIHRALSDRNAEEAKKHAFAALILAKQLGRLHLEVHIDNLAGFIADLDRDFSRAETHHARAERIAGIVQPQSGVRTRSLEYRARAILAQERWAEALELFWNLADEVDAGRSNAHPWDGLFAVGVALEDTKAVERAAERAWPMPHPNALHARTAEVAARAVVDHGAHPAFLARALTAFAEAPGVTDAERARLRTLLDGEAADPS